MCGKEMTTAADLDTELLETLRNHHARYSPFYQGFLSDHGPMGALALHGLGKSEKEVHAWLADYCHRLNPLADAPIVYQRLLAETRAEMKSWSSWRHPRW